MKVNKVQLIALLLLCTGLGFALTMTWKVITEPPAEPGKEPIPQQIVPPQQTPPPPAADQERRVINSLSDPVLLEQLEALGYVEWMYDPDTDKRGVLVHERVPGPWPPPS